MEATFEKQKFGTKLKTMLKVDFKRMFTMPLVYIMSGVCLALPILILVMTTMMGEPQEGAESMGTFTNVWQSFGSVSGSPMSMDLTGMCNINMVFFLIAVLVCVFVGDDFKSGYAKNLFTVRAKRIDYVISKTLVCFVGGAIMLFMYFIGAMIGGGIAGLPFDVSSLGATAGGIVACLFGKLFLALIFVALPLTLAVVGKQKLWISILGSLAAGMLLFMMIPIATPLNANFVHVIMCLAGGGLFAVGLGVVSYLILRKTALI